jgi:hypothetical protein
MTIKTTIKAAALLAASVGALCACGLAQAQSHSVVNYSNPPNVQADSKAATDATPGLSATADQQDANHPGKGARDAAANKGTGGSGVKKQRHASKGPQQRPGTAAASKDGSQSATASVALDGASKGGAEATMQAEPSASESNESAKHAFDSTPAKK